ncbi:cilia- and flagella-associated protein 45 [Cololabis saira]|uniref:cilia- and flagella-associated protein 45 n=1 Tax=Cololabis saira TaxID=129043 RepID=UPI002AD272F5|nr:cilia- and flagella-associated protein 45 [Cololabis saira]
MDILAVKVKDLSKKNKEGEKLQVISRDLIRSVRIPQIHPTRPCIIPQAEFERITSTSQSLIKEERKALKQALQKEKEDKMRAAEERRRLIQEADLFLKNNQAPTELELEAQERAQCTVERANALRAEQEEEIKKLNQLILGAQCQATCDAQIKEKNLIQAELAEEERRLDAMMEMARREALETSEKIDGMHKQQRMRGMQQIYEQIQRRMEEKQIEDEMKEYQKQQIRETQERMNQEDLQALEKKRLEQKLLQEEILRINAAAVRAKERQLEEEKLADIRVVEFQRKKQERDAEYEEEQRRIKKEKELEIARLRAKQEKARDLKAEQDEIRARRNQEMTEREWRMKDSELAAKKAHNEAMLRAARLEQVQHKKHRMFMAASQNRAEDERVLRAQQEAMARQKEEEERQYQKTLRHTRAIHQQMKERELSALAKRRETFKEADQLIEEARQRRMRLDEIKEKKLRELRATGLAEKYCAEVEKKAWTSLGLADVPVLKHRD